jgi:hypothetical protein
MIEMPTPPPRAQRVAPPAAQPRADSDEESAGEEEDDGVTFVNADTGKEHRRMPKTLRSSGDGKTDGATVLEIIDENGDRVTQKHCPGCDNTLDLCHFGIDNRNKDRLNANCKSCVNDRAKKLRRGVGTVTVKPSNRVPRGYTATYPASTFGGLGTRGQKGGSDRPSNFFANKVGHGGSAQAPLNRISFTAKRCSTDIMSVALDLAPCIAWHAGQNYRTMDESTTLIIELTAVGVFERDQPAGTGDQKVVQIGDAHIPEGKYVKINLGSVACEVSNEQECKRKVGLLATRAERVLDEFIASRTQPATLVGILEVHVEVRRKSEWSDALLEFLRRTG